MNSKYTYYVVNKPVGVICAKVDSQVTNIIVKKSDIRYGERKGGEARTTIYDLAKQNEFPTNIGLVGRLDMDTSGIILFTDDARLGSAIRDPPPDDMVHNIFKCKEYELTLMGEKLSKVTNLNALASELGAPFTFQRGGVQYFTSTADVSVCAHYRDESFSHGQGHLGWCVDIRVVIREGKHHQLRRMARRSGLHVLRLHRACIASILRASSVAEGKCRLLTSDEVSALYVGLGLLPVVPVPPSSEPGPEEGVRTEADAEAQAEAETLYRRGGDISD